MQIRPNFKGVLLCALIYGGVSILVFSGMAQGQIALVAAVKRLQIIITLLIAQFWLKEKITPAVWVGSIIMIVGVVLIKLG